MRSQQRKSHAHLIGRTFAELTVTGIVDDTVLSSQKKIVCVCSCGREKTTSLRCLSEGNTKSCGHLKMDPDRIMLQARNMYRHYSTGDIPFEVFYALSQMACVYCGLFRTVCVDENNHVAKPKLQNDSLIAGYDDEQFVFRYNGLDRIDTLIRPYVMDNVVPACKRCNFAKGVKTIAEFDTMVQRMIGHTIIGTPGEYRELHRMVGTDFLDLKGHSALVSTINARIRSYNSRHDDDGLERIDFDHKMFYAMSQLPCYYCGIPPYRVAKGSRYIVNAVKFTGDLTYNGLDRIDSSIGHLLSNCVTCCWGCNSAKSNMTVPEFLALIERWRGIWTGRHITRDAIYVCPRSLIIAPTLPIIP